jgi:hypothetical protein
MTDTYSRIHYIHFIYKYYKLQDQKDFTLVNFTVQISFLKSKIIISDIPNKLTSGIR